MRLCADYCYSQSMPKVIGGETNPTDFQSIDIDSSEASMIVGGTSNANEAVKSISGRTKAIILKYAILSSDFQRLWTKYIDDK